MENAARLLFCGGLPPLIENGCCLEGAGKWVPLFWYWIGTTDGKQQKTMLDTAAGHRYNSLC